MQSYILGLFKNKGSDLKFKKVVTFKIERAFAEHRKSSITYCHFENADLGTSCFLL